MANISYVSNQDAQYRLYGAPTGIYDDYLEDNRERFQRNLSEEKREFFARVKTVKDTWHGEEAIRRGRAAVAKIEGHVSKEDTYQSLDTLLALMMARPMMQSVVLSHPDVSRKHRLGQIEGYGIEFDIKYPERHVHYMDGLVTFDDEGNEEYTQVQYVEGVDEDLKVTHVDQEDIEATYATLKMALARNIDPTSVWTEEVHV